MQTEVVSEEIKEEKLPRMLQEWAFVHVEGSARVIRENLNKNQIVLYKLEDLKKEHMNCRVLSGDEKPKLINLVDMWLEHPERRTYAAGLTFAPDMEVLDRYNLWRGWSVEGCEGDATPWVKFVTDVIADGNQLEQHRLVPISNPKLLTLLGLQNDPRIAKAKQDGATCVLGGERVLESSGGDFVGLTIFDGVREEMALAKEEVFGPVLAVMEFETEFEAIQMANNTTYGLAASVYTTNVSRALRVSRKIRAGNVSVNCFAEGDDTTPFGGYKQSGFVGRDKSIFAHEQYQEIKTIWHHIDDEE